MRATHTPVRHIQYQGPAEAAGQAVKMMSFPPHILGSTLVGGRKTKRSQSEDLENSERQAMLKFGYSIVFSRSRSQQQVFTSRLHCLQSEISSVNCTVESCFAKDENVLQYGNSWACSGEKRLEEAFY